MKKENDIGKGTQNRSGTWLHFLCGIAVGVLIMAAAYFVWYNCRLDGIAVAGGWVIAAEAGEEEQTAPRSLTFYKDRVDIETADGETVSCSYELQESHTRIVIYDFNGLDVVLEYTRQPHLYIEGVGDAAVIWDGDYLFAG